MPLKIQQLNRRRSRPRICIGTELTARRTLKQGQPDNKIEAAYGRPFRDDNFRLSLILCLAEATDWIAARRAERF
jgi:hypothetical protein